MPVRAQCMFDGLSAALLWVDGETGEDSRGRSSASHRKWVRERYGIPPVDETPLTGEMINKLLERIKVSGAVQPRH